MMNDANKNPYVGPRTFQRDEGHLFFGREREARDLLALVVSEQLVLFYAQSGAGKSSIINTRLIPELESRDFEVLPVGRVSGELPSDVEVENIYIYNLMHNIVQHETDPKSLAGLSLTDFLTRLNRDENGYYYDEDPLEEVEGETYLSARRALIIDQFEELFSTHPAEWKKRENFFRQLAQAMRDDPYLWVVLVMREDYIATLDPYAYLLPSGLRVRYYMQRLGRDAALKAIKIPVESSRPYAEGVAEKLVDDLCSIKVQKQDGTLDIQPGQYVEPVQLQVICYNLWENLSSEGTQITEKDLQDVGDVNTSLGNYYAGRVKAVAEVKKVKERKIREWFSGRLITPGGIRSMVMQERNAASGGLDDDVIQALQSDLVRAEKHGGATWYELTHDRLVEPIIENNRNWFNENLSPLQRQAALWRDQEQNESWLLTDQALAEVEQWANDHPDEMTEIEDEFLKACLKHQSQVDERREAQRRELEMAQNLAKEQERLAEEQRKSAEQARQMAEEQERFAKEQERYAQEQAQSAKRAQNLTRVAFSFLALAIIFLGLAGWGIYTSQRNADMAAENANIAATNEADAKDKGDTARARELARSANTSGSLDLSMLLSVEAYNVPVENRDAQSVLFNNGQRSTRLRGFLANSINPASQFRFSPDGKFLAAIKREDKEKENLVLWNLDEDLQKGQVLDSSGIGQFFFSPDNQFLIYLNQDGINTWDLIKNEKRDTINRHIGEVTQVIFDPEGTAYATLGENGNMLEWDPSTSGPNPSVLRGEVTAFSPDGTKFALFELDKITTGFISADNQQPTTIERDPYSVISMAFNPDGSLLVIADKDNNISFWDLVNKKETETSFPSGISAEKMAFLPNGNLAIFNPNDGVRILDAKSGKQINKDPIKGNEVRFSPRNNILAVLDSSSSNLTLYGTETWKKIGESLKGTLAEFSWDGKTLAIFDKDKNKISLVNTSTGTQSGELSRQTPEGTNPVPGVSMAFSRDGNLIAAGFEDGSLTIWEVNSQTVRNSDASSSTSPAISLAFSPDGKQLIAGRRDSTISIWNLSETKPKTKETKYPGHINLINLSPDGKFLYSIASDGIAFLDMKSLASIGKTLVGYDPQFVADNKVLLLFDKESGIILWDTSSHKQIGKTIMGGLMQRSPKERVLETTDKDGKITLWNTLTGDRLTESEDKTVNYTLHDKFVYALNDNGLISLFLDVSSGTSRERLIGQKYIALSPNDNILITSNTPGQLDLWDTATGEPLGKPIKVNKDQNPPYLYFSPRGNVLVTSSIPGKFDVWNTMTGESLGEPVDGGGVVMYNQQDGTSLSILFNQDETRLITHSDSIGTSILWDLTTLKKIGESLPGNIQKISPDGQTIIMGDYNGASLRDFKSGKLIGKPVDESYVNSIFSADGQILAISSQNSVTNSVTLWDMVKMKPIGKSVEGTFIDMSSDGKTLVMRTSLGEIILWDTTNGKQIGSSIRGTSGQIGNTTFDPMGNIQSVVYEGSTKEENTIALLGGKDFDQNPQDTLVISPDEKTFVIFSSDGSLTLWDVHTSTMPGNTVKDFTDSITSALLSPDGNTLAASSKDGIALWNTAKDSLIANLSNSHIKEASDIYLSPDHKTLVTNNNDGDISVWDIGTGKQLADPIHEAFCGFSPDGRILVTATSSNTYTYPSSSYTYNSYCYSSSTPTYTLWDTSTGTQIGDSLTGTYSSYFFTPDSQFITFYSYGASDFKIFKITKSNEGIELIQVGESIPGTFQGFVADDQFVISNDSGNFKLWETDTGLKKRMVISTVSIPIPSSGYVNLWATTREGESALIYAYDYNSSSYSYYLWDMKSPHPPLSPIKIIDHPIFSPNATFMAGSTDKGDFTIWDLTTGKSKTIPGKPSSFSPDSLFIAVTNDSSDTTDTTTSIWSTSAGKKVSGPFKGSFWGFSGSTSEVISFRDDEGGFVLYNTLSGNRVNEKSILGDGLMFSPDGHIFASYQTQGGISLWHTSTVDSIGSIPGQLIGFSADGKTLVTTSTNEGGFSEVSFWDTKTSGLRVETFTYHGSFAGIRVSEDRNFISIFGNEGIFAWDLTNPNSVIPIPRIADTAGETTRMVFSPEGKTLATVGNDGIILWYLSSSKPIASPKPIIGSTGRIADISFKDNKTIVYIDADGSLFKLDLANAAQLPTEQPQKKFNTACRMSFSPHGEHLAYKSGKKLHIWNVDTNSDFAVLEENISCDGPMAFSEDGNSLAYSESNRVYVRTFDESGKVTKKVELTGTFNHVNDLTFVVDNKILAVTDTNSRIFLWDVNARTLLGTFDQSGSAKKYANGKLQIYLPSEQRLIQLDFEDNVWQSLLTKWQADLCMKAGRTLTPDEWQQYFPDLSEPKEFSCPMPKTEPVSNTQ